MVLLYPVLADTVPDKERNRTPGRFLTYLQTSVNTTLFRTSFPTILHRTDDCSYFFEYPAFIQNPDVTLFALVILFFILM